MIYLKLSCPPLEGDEKRRIVGDLTDVVMRIPSVRPDQRRRCIIELCSLAREDLAIGGVLLCDMHRSYYKLEVSPVGLDANGKAMLAHDLTAALARALDLTPDALSQIHVVFRDLDSDDVAVGGRLLSSVVPAAVRGADAALSRR